MATLDEAYAIGMDHHRAGRLDAAETIYRRILDADPDQPDALHLLGVAAAQRRRFAEAVDLITAATAKNPRNPTYFANLGGALKSLGRYEDAERRLAQASILSPSHPDALTNLGSVHSALGRFDAAIRCGRRAAAMDPSRFEPWLNLGVALRDAGDPTGAEAAFAAARAVNPHNPHLDYELAVLRLSQGDLAEGWRLFESRWDFVDQSPASLGRPMWRGEDPAGKTVLVYFEQGLGDTVQFVRYAPMLTARGARVVVLTQPPLKRLIAPMAEAGVASVLGFGDPVPDFDLCRPMMSLPLAFGTTPDDIPSGDAYLAPPADLTKLWGERLTERLGPRRRPRVGLAWSGSPRPHDPKSNALDRRRSLPFARLAPLFDVAGVDFVSLQKGAAATQAAEAVADGRLADLMPEVGDFADTAALMAHLDLVISVDTSVVHVAAATGRPTWMLSRYDGCWRWLRDRDDSPWYPTLRLYRQTSPGDWDEPVLRLAADLARRKSTAVAETAS